MTTIYSWVVFFCFVGGNPRYVFILYTKNMKKSFLFSLMAILLAGFWFGGVSLADDLDCSENAVANSGVVACINNTTWYTTLALAIANAQDNDTISLMDDITFTANIDGYIYAYVEKSININLNWHTIDPDDNVLWFKWDIEASIYSWKIIDEDKNWELFVSDWASLTIKDWEYKWVWYYPVIHIKQGWDLTIENATITSTHSAAWACIYNEWTLTIENANITALNYLWIQNEWTLTIENATIIAPNYLWISNKWTLTIENATITAKSWIKNHAWKDITINDVTITTTNGKWIQNEWTLTIENGTISTTNEHNISTLSGSILTINDGTFSHADDYGILYVEWDTTVTIDSWDFSSDGWLIVWNGSEWKWWYTININWGTFTTLGDFPAIYHPNNWTLNITDGTFEWADALYLKSWETNISGGKFIGKWSQVDFEHRNDGIKPTWDWVVVEVCDYPGGEPTINITAWEFESDNADAIASYAQEGYTALTGFLVWWIFSPEPDESYISDGYYAKEIDDDKYEITEVQTIDTIDITSEITGVYVWELPEFEATTTTSWLDVSVYWSNTNWHKRPNDASNWQWLWSETAAVADGTTHYALRLQLNKDEWYVFGDDVTINFNWIDWTASGHTLLDKWFTWWGYLYIDLGIAIVLPTEISAISLSGSATISLWDELDLLKVENVEDPMTAWYGYSSYFPVKWVEDEWTEVNTTDEPSAVAWTNYWLRVNLNIEDNFQLSTNPTLTYNGEDWTASGHTAFDLENNAIYIDLWIVAAEEPTPDVEELLVPDSWTTASAWSIDDIPLDNAEATTGFDANDYAWVTTPQVIIQQKTDSAALQEEWTSESALENALTTDFVADTGKVADMQWILDIQLIYLDWSGNATPLWNVVFSDPVKIMIPVKSWASNVQVRSKHDWDTSYGTVWLTLNVSAHCNDDGTVQDDADAYTWWDVPLVNGRAEIYTCLASSFVAYTETDKQSSTPSNGGSSWGGSSKTTPSNGGWSSKTTKADDTKATTWDNTKLDETKADGNNEENVETKADEGNGGDIDGQKPAMTEAQAVEKFGQEQIDAYKWALENGITTMKTVEEARLDEPLTRAELAKMMVVYIQKVLKKDPVVTWDVNYPDVKVEEIWDLVDFVKLAYQYQIMWINADGTPIELFNPHGIVSRWEYATVFSRVLFGAKFNKEGADFYTNHLEALKTAGILTNTLPTIQEMRGWVMLMMYRSSQNGEAIEKVANSTEEIVDEAKAEEIVSEETVNVSDEEKSGGWIDTEETTKDSTEESVSDESSETPVNTAEATTWDALSE